MVDLRSINKGAVYSLENAHSQPIRDLDFNPNRQYLMATGGDDGCTKFWDIRNIQSPVLSRQDHFHWYVLSWCKDLAQHYANILFFKGMASEIQRVSRSADTDSRQRCSRRLDISCINLFRTFWKTLFWHQRWRLIHYLILIKLF